MITIKSFSQVHTPDKPFTYISRILVLPFWIIMHQHKLPAAFTLEILLQLANFMSKTPLYSYAFNSRSEWIKRRISNRFIRRKGLFETINWNKMRIASFSMVGWRFICQLIMGRYSGDRVCSFFNVQSNWKLCCKWRKNRILSIK